jgi:hypothetical protein
MYTNRGFSIHITHIMYTKQGISIHVVGTRENMCDLCIAAVKIQIARNCAPYYLSGKSLDLQFLFRNLTTTGGACLVLGDLLCYLTVISDVRFLKIYSVT